MTAVKVELGERSYDVVVGRGVLGTLADVLADRARVAVVSQAAVAERWAGGVVDVMASIGAATEVFLMGDGEEAKSLATVEDLCRRFARWGLLRGDAVVALGGGVVGDTAGFTAAAYHRGIGVVQVPTTLLAQVDAAIGGKTGVNLPEGKNLVGAFHQPLAVVADVDTLVTLPEREYRSGLGEVAKYAAVLDPELAAIVEGDAGALLARRPEVLGPVVERCAAVKARVVSADEHERTGLRATLNYGHTLAHALETVGHYGFTHGEAVAVGIVFAAELAWALGRIDAVEVGRQRSLVDALGLPAAAGAGSPRAEVLAQMRRDKKSSGGLTFVLPGPAGLELVEVADGEALRTACDAVEMEERA